MPGRSSSCSLLRAVLPLVLLIPLCHSDAAFKTEREVTSDCVCVPSDRKGEDLKPDDITVVENPAAGTLLVEFPNRTTGPSYFEVSLFVNPQAATNNEPCKTFNIKHKRNFHSMQRFDSSVCADVRDTVLNSTAPCEMRARMTFKNIFSGCYLVKVSEHYIGNNLYTSTNSRAKLLHTEKKKNSVWKMKPVVGKQANVPTRADPDNMEVTIVIANFSMLFEERLLIHMFLQNDSKCNFFNHAMDMAAWDLTLSDQDDVIIQKKDDPFLQECHQVSNRETVNCKFVNMKPGNYCLWFKPDHPYQCEDSVWTWENDRFNTCMYKHSFVVESLQPGPVPELQAEDIDTLTIVVSVAVLCVLLFLVIGTVVHSRRKLPREVPLLSPSSPSDKVLHDPFGPKVLLLYALDCAEFMSLMETFRDLLHVTTNCEILDCFDMERCDVAVRPIDWMRYWASRPEVRVIVVASPCAMAHQQATAANIFLGYEMPTTYCGLFRVGLDTVTRSECRQYNNTFVASFDGSDLDYIVANTRYSLPLAVNELLKDMKMPYDERNLSEDSVTMKELKRKHGELLRHHSREQDYVTKLMCRHSDVVS